MSSRCFWNLHILMLLTSFFSAGVEIDFLTESGSSHSGGWEFSLLLLWRVRVITSSGESSHRIGWEFSMWGVTFRIHGCESHCGRRKLSVVGEISLSLRQRFRWSMWEFSLVYCMTSDSSRRIGWEFSSHWVRVCNVVSESFDLQVRVSLR